MFQIMLDVAAPAMIIGVMVIPILIVALILGLVLFFTIRHIRKVRNDQNGSQSEIAQPDSDSE